MQTLTFYFDFISPYAYLAWTQIHPLAARHGYEVDPRPILFAALLDANGQKGPAEIPRKRIYTFKDVTRSAHRLGVPLAPPASHPFSPLLALRVASAGRTSSERRAVIDALFVGTRVNGLDVSASASLEALLGEAGFDGRGLVVWAASPEAKEKVRQTTAEALEAGAFGVPTIVVEGDLFWGLDSFANLELRLDGKGPPWGRPPLRGPGSRPRRAAPGRINPRSLELDAGRSPGRRKEMSATPEQSHRTGLA